MSPRQWGLSPHNHSLFVGASFSQELRDRVTGIEVSETDGGQRITCHLKQADKSIPKGVYKVRLASHGLDPTDPLTVATLTVTLLEDIPAVPTVRIDKVVSQDGTEDAINFFGGVAHVEGENLALLPGDTVKLRGKLASTGEDDEHLFDDFAYDAETGEIDITIGDDELTFVGSDWQVNAGADIVVTSRGGVAGSEPQVVTRHVTLPGV